jgi:2-aminoadipate transaminase
MLATSPASYSFSSATQHLKRSVMRDLLKHAVDPNIISLAGGLPANEALPLTQLQACLDEVLHRDGAKALQYGPPYAPLKAWLADYMRGRGVQCDAENIFITNGNQHGLQILSRLFVNEGDTAVIEEAVFTGVQQITAGAGAHILTIPTDTSTGADMDALEAAFAQHPQMAVLIPDFHNPLGVSLSAEKRQRAAELAGKYGVPLVEDDPYSALRFSGAMLPPIKAYDTSGFVFYLGSFSKMLAPALRLGWMIVPDELLAKITVIRESLDLESSTLTQRTVAEFLQRGYLVPHLDQMNRLNQERCAALLAALDTHLGDIASWTLPDGGLFTWVTLPENVNTWDMLPEAIANKVVYIPGAAFAVNGGATNAMRLNFSALPAEKFDEAISRLKQVINNYLK